MAKNAAPSVSSVEEMLAKIEATRARMETDEEFRESLVNPHPSGNPISLGRRIPDPQEIADLQVAGVQANAEKWLKRVTKPKKNFKEEALKPQSVERYKESMRKVIAEDRHKGGMELVDEAEAIATIQAGGSSIYSSGVARRKPKILRVAKELDSDRLALAAIIDEKPVATDTDREAKMIDNVRGLKAIGAKRRGVKVS